MPATMTPKGQETRERIIATAARLIHRQGYKHTGLQQILSESGVTKGAFYFHFKDKKALALEVIDFFQHFFLQHLAADLDHRELPARERLERFHLQVRSVFGGETGMVGCPIGNLTLELAGLDAELRARLEQCLDHMTRDFARVIGQGQACGEFTRRQDPAALAEFFINSWEGAVLRMKSTRSLAPLDRWFESITLLLAKEPG